MKFLETKKIIQDLVSKSESHTMQYDENSMKTTFIQPFFEALGWDFQTDVKDPIDDTAADKIFQIDGVTRFYLKILPYDASIESFRKQIESLVGLAYNKGVTWAIATNFKEMRVYNTEAPGSSLAAMQHFSFTESEYVAKFDDYLSDLTKHQFSLNVLDSDAEYFGKKPKRIPIDKQLLEDLLSFRNLLASDIVKNNSINEENAAQNAQKILNRLIFIRSCGDRQIEERHLKSSLSSWEENKNKTLIQYLQEIFVDFNDKYGSTLFEKHSCESLIISDGILKDVINGLYKSKQKAVEYNFAHIEHDSLGKMYENYLGTVQQKKDGAYYTPSYISKYICENTIIPYLSKSNVATIPDLISEYEHDLEELESKIHDIKILDPACGTGEFLIRAIDILLEISKQIQRKKELQGKYQTVDSTSRKAPRSLKKKKSDLTTFQTFDKDIENQQLRTIIQNNIHGVDINEEAIEITQLNLFLKLATSSQQLIDLSKNLRVGNCLVDDPDVDPKAFDWEKEFPEKFDVVIGNPPYVRQEKFKELKKFLQKKYDVFVSTADLYTYFYEIGFKLLCDNGTLGYISSNKFMRAKYGSYLRTFLKFNTCIINIIDFGDKQLFDAITNTTVVITKKGYKKNNELLFSDDIKFKQIIPVNQDELDESAWTLADENILNLKKKIEAVGLFLKEWNVKINYGLKTGFNEAYLIDNETKINFCNKDHKNNEIIKPIIRGRDIGKYFYRSSGLWIINTHNGYTVNNKNILPINAKKDYPIIYNHLIKINDDTDGQLEKRTDHGKHWTNLRDCSFLENFKTEKIIWLELTSKNKFAYSVQEEYILAGAFMMTGESLKYLLAFLNSSVCQFYFKLICNSSGMGTIQWKKFAVERIPIPRLDDKTQQPFIKLVDQILNITNELEYLQNQNNQILVKKLEEKINFLFYKLYEITDEEKAIIESSI